MSGGGLAQEFVFTSFINLIHFSLISSYTIIAFFKVCVNRLYCPYKYWRSHYKMFVMHLLPKGLLDLGGLRTTDLEG